MPELPEVETIRRGLEKKIIGLKIRRIEVLNPKSFQGNPNLLRGKEILNIWRKAKILGVDLTGNISLLIHLKMSGQIILVGSRVKGVEGSKNQKNILAGGHPTRDMLNKMPNKSTRVIFQLSYHSKPYVLSKAKGKVQQVSAKISSERERSWSLYFNDQRKFGWIKIVKTSDLNDDLFLKKLGPEPLEKSFTPEILKDNLLKHPKTLIKLALLDQSIVSGIGNIYACEACFNARIDPRKPTNQLTNNELTKLHQGIIDALNLSLQKGGSSKRHYINAAGEKGVFLDFAYVYDRQDQPCKVCLTKIEKITLGGRGTYFCPKCQK